MRTVADARDWAEGQWQRNWKRWLTTAEADAKSWPLHPPSQAQFAADPEAVARWARSWRDLRVAGVEVEWVERRWPAYGRQLLPQRIVASPEAIAGLAGHASEWRRANANAARLRDQWPGFDLSAATRLAARALSRLDDHQTERLIAVLGWLIQHPGSDLWERELPVPGIDTKWWEQHRSLVEPFALALTGQQDAAAPPNDPVFGVRVLDPGLSDGPQQFTAGVAGLNAARLVPRVVLMSENQVPVLRLPALPGVVGIHSMGFAAVNLAKVAWIRDAPQLYWGDLDSYGFRILGQLRQVLPNVRSVLMDARTLHRHAELIVAEPHPYRGEIGYLSAAERSVVAEIRRGDLRLEQERIDKAYAHAELTAAVATIIRLAEDRG